MPGYGVRVTRVSSDGHEEAHRLLERARSIMGVTNCRGGAGRLVEQVQRADDELTAWSLRNRTREVEVAGLIAELRAAALRLRAAEILRRQEATERLQASLRNLQQFDST